MITPIVLALVMQVGCLSKLGRCWNWLLEHSTVDDKFVALFDRVVGSEKMYTADEMKTGRPARENEPEATDIEIDPVRSKELPAPGGAGAPPTATALDESIDTFEDHRKSLVA